MPILALRSPADTCGLGERRMTWISVQTSTLSCPMCGLLLCAPPDQQHWTETDLYCAEWREYKLIYKRYASLFFITCGLFCSPLEYACAHVCVRVCVCAVRLVLYSDISGLRMRSKVCS